MMPVGPGSGSRICPSVGGEQRGPGGGLRARWCSGTACVGGVILAVLSACQGGELNLQVVHQAAPESQLEAHADAYLNALTRFTSVAATLACDPMAPNTCLLRIDAHSNVYEGESQSLILYVATGAQPLPGDADLSAVYQDAYGQDPVTYAAIEAVEPDEAARRYNYLCRYAGGTLRLNEVPRVGETLTGQFDALEVSCRQAILPDEEVPALLTGTFAVEVEARGY